MLAVGFVTVTEAPVVALNPTAGLHEYVFDVPVAVNAIGTPKQVEGEFTFIVGSGFTVTLIVSEERQVPLPKV